MKLYISNSGIYEPVYNKINDVRQELFNARYHQFYCPSDFKYASEVRNLRNEFSNLARECSNINSALKKAESNYNILFHQYMRKIRYTSDSRFNERVGVREIE